ncbi:MAG: Hsp70 family protein [Pikeienuella sp.]
MGAHMLAIDFGTSNSAAAVLDGGRPRRLAIEAGADTLPTAVFFPTRGGAMRIGVAASDALIAGDDGRYMRALKSVLGTALFHEPRLVGGSRRTLADIVTAFLKVVKQRAEAETGKTYTAALSGRPVHFHSADPVRDARAEDDLRACYHAAGFDDVTFMFEPEAAALASHGLGRAGEVGLIVDIGGGTSDFTVFRTGHHGIEILASHGIRLGGTDFDQAVSMMHAMPLLGHGGELRREFGPGHQPVPNAIYLDLATWAKIPFLYNRETSRTVATMARLAVAPELLRRLENVLEDETGHQLAFAVEAGKIAANSGEQDARIDMAFIERGLSAGVTATSLAAALQKYREDLYEAAQQTLLRAGVAPDAVGAVILVGGSSLMSMVESVGRDLCPGATIERSEAFTAVVDGLALATS